LADAVQVFAGRALRGPMLAYALIAEPVDPRVEQERLAYRLAYADSVGGLITEGMQAGDFGAQDATGSAAALVGCRAEGLAGPSGQQQTDSGRRQPLPDAAHQQLIHALTALCLRALGAPASTGVTHA